MGHKRRARAAPSPMQLLSIMTAKEEGIPLEEISHRTGYSRSSITRWWQMWHTELAFIEAVKCEMPELLDAYCFDLIYPEL